VLLLIINITTWKIDLGILHLYRSVGVLKQFLDNGLTITKQILRALTEISKTSSAVIGTEPKPRILIAEKVLLCRNNATI